MASPVTGLAGIERRMKALAADVATKVGQAATRAGTKKLADGIHANAPVGPMAEGAPVKRKRKSGQEVSRPHHKITNHIKVKKVCGEAGKVINAVVIDAVHASILEFGSIHIQPTHFAQTGIDNATDDALIEISKVLERRLKKLGI